MTNLITQYTAPPIVEQNTAFKKADNKKVKIGSIAGAAIGIAAAVGGVYALAKKGNPSTTFMNLKYENKDILMIGAGSVLGGLAGGLITDSDKRNVNPKLREASQQFFGNMVCPITILTLGDKALDALKINIPDVMKTGTKFAKFVNNGVKYLPKAAMTICALVSGMEIGNAIMNKINNKIFKEEVKHDVHAEDYLVHADDICLTADRLLTDSPTVSKITSKLLPLSFILSGSKTGMQQADK